MPMLPTPGHESLLLFASAFNCKLIEARVEAGRGAVSALKPASCGS